MADALVSVITISYNSEKHIKKTIESVLDQTYKNIEYILIDGDSSDDTIKIIRNYQKKHPEKINFISEKDNGIYDAMNKGINIANGKVIGILNSDDWYEPKAIENIIRVYKNTNKKVIIHGGMKFWTESEEYLYKDLKDYNEINEKKIKKSMIINHPTVFVSKDIYDEIGVFDTNYNICADYEFILRAFFNGYKFIYINKILTNMRLGGISNKSSTYITRCIENYKARRKWMNTYQNIYLSFKDLPLFYTRNLVKNMLRVMNLDYLIKLYYKIFK